MQFGCITDTFHYFFAHVLEQHSYIFFYDFSSLLSITPILYIVSSIVYWKETTSHLPLAMHIRFVIYINCIKKKGGRKG